jgi:tRNA dimethylallyltransferase
MAQIEVITGPTASGKTELAIQRAKSNPDIEFVNADASLLYRGFDIGTAKPSKEIRSRFPHHIIDLLQPEERFSAGEYAALARATIRKIIAAGKTPLVVGGTGFYIDALFGGIASLEVDEKNAELARIRVTYELSELGFESMHERLRNIDPVLFEQIGRERNPRRLERAWEFYYATGIPLGEARRAETELFEFEPSYTLLEVERDQLRKRIIDRIDSMIASGWIMEVQELLAKGVTIDMPAMKAIGYRELARVVHGENALAAAREEIVIRTRQYAKRQVTWMKRYKNS